METAGKHPFRALSGWDSEFVPYLLNMSMNDSQVKKDLYGHMIYNSDPEKARVSQINSHSDFLYSTNLWLTKKEDMRMR